MSSEDAKRLDELLLDSVRREANELYGYLTGIPEEMHAYAEPYRKRLERLEQEEEEIKRRLWGGQ